MTRTVFFLIFLSEEPFFSDVSFFSDKIVLALVITMATNKDGMTKVMKIGAETSKRNDRQQIDLIL